MISLYQNIIISFGGEQVSDKTKQVQVRLTPEIHNSLKGNLALEGRKLVDFFNEAAQAYLANPEKYNKALKSINGGNNNG